MMRPCIIFALVPRLVIRMHWEMLKLALREAVSIRNSSPKPSVRGNMHMMKCAAARETTWRPGMRTSSKNYVGSLDARAAKKLLASEEDQAIDPDAASNSTEECEASVTDNGAATRAASETFDEVDGSSAEERAAGRREAKTIGIPPVICLLV